MPVKETVFEDGDVPRVAYSALRASVRDGDLLLASGNYPFSKIIRSVSMSVFSHVGFLMWLRPLGRLMVFESVESGGVRTVPLSSYLRDYSGSGEAYDGRILIARHDAVQEHPLALDDGQRFRAFSTAAIDRLGHSYDRLGGLRMAAHILSDGELFDDIGSPANYVCGEYVAACYESLGISVVRGKNRSITPVDFAADKNVNAVAIPTL